MTDLSNTVSSLKKRLSDALFIVNQLPVDWPLSYIDKVRCNDISVNLLYAEKALRAAFHDESVTGINKSEVTSSHQPALEIPSEICHVTRPENALVSVTLPVILPKGRSEWYSAGYRKRHPAESHLLDSELERIVAAQLRADIAQNGPICVPQNTLFLVFRRKLQPCLETAKVVHVDNNNVETGAVTNAISRVLGKGDGYHNMGFVYIAIPSDKSEIEAVLCEYDKLKYWVSPFK
jgi:hypothetical protein